jgi:hypothetical protein
VIVVSRRSSAASETIMELPEVTANIPVMPPRYLRTPEAARFVGLSLRTLEKHRIYGAAPRSAPNRAWPFPAHA